MSPRMHRPPGGKRRGKGSRGSFVLPATSPPLPPAGRGSPRAEGTARRWARAPRAAASTRTRRAAAAKAPPVREASRELPCHERAVRIRLVVAERPAVGEAEALVERARRDEPVLRAGLEVEPAVPAPLRLRDDVLEHRAARAAAAQRLGRAH